MPQIVLCENLVKFKLSQINTSNVGNKPINPSGLRPSGFIWLIASVLGIYPLHYAQIQLTTMRKNVDIGQ